MSTPQPVLSRNVCLGGVRYTSPGFEPGFYYARLHTVTLQADGFYQGWLNGEDETGARWEMAFWLPADAVDDLEERDARGGRLDGGTNAPSGRLDEGESDGANRETSP